MSNEALTFSTIPAILIFQSAQVVVVCINVMIFILAYVHLHVHVGLSLLRPMYYEYPESEESYVYDRQVHSSVATPSLFSLTVVL